MSQLIQLVVVVVLVYLFECLHLTPRGAVGLQSFVVGYRLIRAAPIGILPRRGMLFAMPVPPLGALFVAAPWPVVPTEDGVIADDGSHLGWEALREARAEESVVLAGKVRVARAASEPAARALASLLAKMAAETDAAARTALLDQALGARLAVAPARARVRLLRRATWPLRIATNLLFLCVFVGGPLLLFTPLIARWRDVAAVSLAAWMMSAAAFYAACDMVFRDGPDGPPSGKRFGVALMPLSTIRGLEVLALYAVAPFDPWAVAAALLPRARFEDLARETLADLHYREELDDPEHADRAFFESRLRPAIAASLAALEIKPASLFAPPAPDGPVSRSFCPRCRAQHVVESGRCTTCPGMPLLALQDPAPPRVPFIEAPPPVQAPEAPAAPAKTKGKKARGRRAG